MNTLMCVFMCTCTCVWLSLYTSCVCVHCVCLSVCLFVWSQVPVACDWVVYVTRRCFVHTGYPPRAYQWVLHLSAYKNTSTYFSVW